MPSSYVIRNSMSLCVICVAQQCYLFRHLAHIHHTPHAQLSSMLSQCSHSHFRFSAVYFSSCSFHFIPVLLIPGSGQRKKYLLCFRLMYIGVLIAIVVISGMLLLLFFVVPLYFFVFHLSFDHASRHLFTILNVCTVSNIQNRIQCAVHTSTRLIFLPSADVVVVCFFFSS